MSINDELFLDIWTFTLTFMGVMVSVMTLLYSFIMGKKGELATYAELNKLNDKIDPIIQSKHKFAQLYIKRLVKINARCGILLALSFIINIVSWITARFLTEHFYFGSFMLIAIIALLTIIVFIVQCKKIIIQYRDDIRI